MKPQSNRWWNLIGNGWYCLTTGDIPKKISTAQNLCAYTRIHFTGITDTTNTKRSPIMCSNNDTLYIYQVLCLEVTMQQNMFPHSTEHGPCESEVKGVEYDIVVCLACDFWPSSAYSWIDRYHSWPDKDIVNAIVRSGCHCVPIGNPLGLHTQEDWRISFSQAEHQLVQTRTHCHFLVYWIAKNLLERSHW